MFAQFIFIFIGNFCSILCLLHISIFPLSSESFLVLLFVFVVQSLLRFLKFYTY